ncbi:MAG: hypothetical protein ACE5Q6_08145 [Dehalococcoidia bacterium]
MLVRNMLIATVTLGLTAFFLMLSFGGMPGDAAPPPSVIQMSGQTPTRPSPTSVPPTPTFSPPPTHAEACEAAGPPPDLTEIEVFGPPNLVVARIYCSGPDLKYVTFVDQHDQLTRTSLFIDGRLRVKIYYSNGHVFRRKDYDENGYRVPDRAQITLPSSQIGPHLR